MRILKTTGLKRRRRVRLGLWSGEEQGLLGSRAYVRDHLADVQTMQLQAGPRKLSACYNLDCGQGAIRGVYLQPPQDMMKNAVIVAAFVYHTANRQEKLPPLSRGRATSAQQ